MKADCQGCKIKRLSTKCVKNGYKSPENKGFCVKILTFCESWRKVLTFRQSGVKYN